MLMYMLELVKQHLNQQRIGGVAHMVERSLRMREARGSIPRTSIFFLHNFFALFLAHVCVLLYAHLFFFFSSQIFYFILAHVCVLLYAHLSFLFSSQNFALFWLMFVFFFMPSLKKNTLSNFRHG